MILKTKLVISLVTVVTLGLPSLNHCTAQQPTAQDVLDMLEGSVQSIKSFDIAIHATTKMYIITEGSWDLSEGRKEFVISNKRTLVAGEKPKTSQAFFRQVFQRGKGRIEFFDDERAKPTNYLVCDNETQKSWSPGQRIASIDRPHLTSVMVGMDYRECYLTLLGRAEIVKCLRPRRNCKVERKTPDDPLIVLEAGPVPKTGLAFHDFGFRVTIDSSHGFMPSVLEEIREVDGKLFTSAKREITAWKELGGGVWAPTRMVSQHFDLDPKWPNTFGKVNDEVVLQVDLKLSSWNQDIPEDTFDLPLPAGATVTDFRREVKYVTGESDPGKNLDDLASHARDLVPIHLGVKPPSNRWTQPALITGSILVLAVVGLFIFFRRRRKRIQGV